LVGFALEAFALHRTAAFSVPRIAGNQFEGG
jgi:hypothetical protein